MKHILYLITGKEPEDSLSVRNVEQSFNRFPECWVKNAESCNNDVNGMKKTRTANKEENMQRRHPKERGILLILRRMWVLKRGLKLYPLKPVLNSICTIQTETLQKLK